MVKRAEDEDLNKDVRYHVAFIRNPQGRVITDVSPQPQSLANTCSAASYRLSLSADMACKSTACSVSALPLSVVRVAEFSRKLLF